MELRHLRYFLTVAEQGGVRSAAEQLDIAQPTISRQIKDLEAELGFALFLREGRGLVLTDAGRVYLEKARAVLAAVEAAGEEARQVAEGRGGRLVIGLLQSASWSGPAPEALSRFARAHPDVMLEVRPMRSVAQFKAVAEGALDGGFAYAQGEEAPRGLRTLPLRQDDVVFAAPRDLVFDHDGPLELDDIDGLPMVGFPRKMAPHYHDRLAAATRALGFQARVVQVAEDEATILSLVSAGVGCAIVNSANRDRPPRNVQLREVRGLSVPLTMVFLHRQPPGEMVRRLLRALLAD